jgi:hypothetical protein
MCAGNCLPVKPDERGGDRRGGPQEGPARDAECPTSDAAARVGGACGPAGRSGGSCSRLGLFADPTTQAVAFELDAVGIVNDAVQYGIAKRGIGNHVMP